MVYKCNEMAQKNENWVLTSVKISIQRFSNGRKEERNRINKLIQCLIRDDRMDDVIRGTADFEYQKTLRQEYQL